MQKKAEVFFLLLQGLWPDENSGIKKPSPE